MISAKNRLTAYHIAFWLLYVTFAILTFGYKVGIFNVARETIVSYGISIGIFYCHYLVLKAFMPNRRPILYLVSLAGLLAVNFTLKYLVFNVAWPYIFQVPSSASGGRAIDLLIIYTWQASTFLILSSAYWLAERLLRLERRARQRENEEARSEKLLLENAALRAQINPHFLVNSLVHIAREAEEELPHVAEFASSLMTYTQSSIIVTDNKGMIDIDEEAAALEALIHIYQQRFPDAHIRYMRDFPSGLRIVPHILTPFVENALKHGDFSRPDNAMLVFVDYTDGTLHFSSYNKKRRGPRDKSRGIGLSYVKRQLETAFKDNYNLVINDTSDYFLVELHIYNIEAPDHYKQNKRAAANSGWFRSL